MEGRASLEGWAPDIGGEVPLAEVVDLAFDYRGDVTIVRTDGTEVVGYVSNRDAEAREPFVQVLQATGREPVTIPYASIRAIRFTGRDAAAGRAFTPPAWLEARPSPGRKG
jgi:hypothetical protein